LFSVTVYDSDLINVTDKLSTINISKKFVTSRKDNKCLKGPLDQFLIRKEVKDTSLTLSDFECDSVGLDLSDIVNRIIV